MTETRNNGKEKERSIKTALFYIVWKNSLRRYKVVRTPEQTIKGSGSRD
jgi:hypothetical protein